MKAINRISQIIEERGLKRSKVEKDLELSNGYLNTMGKNNSSLGEEIILKFSHYFNVSTNYLLTGGDNNLIAAEPDPIYNLKKIDYNRLPLIPINAIAGMNNGVNDSILEVDCVYYDVPEFKNKADYLIRIAGSSMSPKYHSGDIVACKRLALKDIFFQWNKVYVVDTVQGALVKRVKKSDLGPDHIQLFSENLNYDPFDIPIKAINALGLVIGVIRLE